MDFVWCGVSSGSRSGFFRVHRYADYMEPFDGREGQVRRLALRAQGGRHSFGGQARIGVGLFPETRPLLWSAL